jgi:hypothetical protein
MQTVRAFAGFASCSTITPEVLNPDRCEAQWHLFIARRFSKHESWNFRVYRIPLVSIRILTSCRAE